MIFVTIEIGIYMNKQKIIEKLSKKIVEEIIKQPEKNIKPDEKIISSGLIDSFSLVDLALGVEDLFGVRIEDTELNSDCFDSLSQLADLIIVRM